jgi:hypothetical protein
MDDYMLTKCIRNGQQQSVDHMLVSGGISMQNKTRSLRHKLVSSNILLIYS